MKKQLAEGEEKEVTMVRDRHEFRITRYIQRREKRRKERKE